MMGSLPLAAVGDLAVSRTDPLDSSSTSGAGIPERARPSSSPPAYRVPRLDDPRPNAQTRSERR